MFSPSLISQRARDTRVLPARLSLVLRTPQLILGHGSAPRTQGVLWRGEECRRCGGRWSFLNRLYKWD